MKQYFRIMLGRSGCFADQCKVDGYVGADFNINQDLSAKLPEDMRDFNDYYAPIYLNNNPTKKKVAAGLACGTLWAICKRMQIGDIVLSPNGHSEYYVGEVVGNYYYVPNTDLPHRRKVRWFDKIIARADMSDELKNSTGSVGTYCDISRYKDEIEGFLNDVKPITLKASSDDVENPSEFALEKHLEEFLIKNWAKTDIGKDYDIYEEDGEMIGEQYPSDTGPIDILAISKDKKTILVIELKRGRVSDVVVGQIQRYMGYVKDELLEQGQTVKGLIIGIEADTRLRRALSVCNNIEFYRYQIDFKLIQEI